MRVSDEFEKKRTKSYMERVTFATEVQFKSSRTSVVYAHCNDLSVGGLYLNTNFKIDIDETVNLSFSIPNDEQEISIECQARVAWTNFYEKRRKLDYPVGVGLQFLDLPGEKTAELSKFIGAYDGQKKMNVVCAWCGSYLGMRKGRLGTTSHGICSQCLKNIEQDTML